MEENGRVDSFSLYRNYCNLVMNKDDDKALEYVDRLVKRIYEELCRPPFLLDISTFLLEVKNMLEKKKHPTLSEGENQAAISSTKDVYVILLVLEQYLSKITYSAKENKWACELEQELFKGKSFQNEDNKKAVLISIENSLNSIKEFQQHKKDDHNLEKKQESASKVFERGIGLTEASKRGALHPASNSCKIPSLAKGPGMLGRPSEIDTIQASSMEPFRQNTGAMQAAAPIFENKRRQENQINIQKWHEEQDGIHAALLEMQPKVSELLKGFLSFSDRITENYVLQFAAQMIELFDLIWDGYEYHKHASRKSRSQDYKNAVSNYEEYMYTISDILSVFGIEEIISEPGTRFDGGIHDPDSARFSTAAARVAESVRCGFRYKDIVIQKEKVKLN